MRTTLSRSRLSASSAVLTPMAVLAMLFAANCGGGGSQSNPPPPRVIIDAEEQFVDVGQRFELDGSRTTDPDGNFEDIEFQWRIVEGGLDTDFEDHCRTDFDEICDENTDDHCSNDVERFCNEDDDCVGFATCNINTGTSSPDCTTGICGLEEGDDGVQATFIANVAGPFSVRLTAIGNKANGTDTMILQTFPSLFVVGSVFEFGGTQGALVREIEDANEFAPGASEGASDPQNGNLVLIDDNLGLVRVFDLRTGEIVGPFGQSDAFVDDPAAIAFHPENGRLYVAQADGEVLVFEGTTGLLINTFGNVGANPLSMKFSPVTGDLLVVTGVSGSGVKVFDGADGSAEGVLGSTAAATTEPVDIDFLDNALLIADRTGRVVRCNSSGNNCGAFSDELDGLLANGSPSSIAVNPSREFTNNDVMVADPVGERVIACSEEGTSCETFGETDEIDSEYEDIFFAPDTAPTTTSSTSTTTTLEEQ